MCVEKRKKRISILYRFSNDVKSGNFKEPSYSKLFFLRVLMFLILYKQVLDQNLNFFNSILKRFIPMLWICIFSEQKIVIVDMFFLYFYFQVKGWKKGEIFYQNSLINFGILLAQLAPLSGYENFVKFKYFYQMPTSLFLSSSNIIFLFFSMHTWRSKIMIYIFIVFAERPNLTCQIFEIKLLY